MSEVSDKEPTFKERTAEANAVADRLERINDALEDIVRNQVVSEHSSEKHIRRAREALMAAADELESQ